MFDGTLDGGVDALVGKSGLRQKEECIDSMLEWQDGDWIGGELRLLKKVLIGDKREMQEGVRFSNEKEENKGDQTIVTQRGQVLRSIVIWKSDMKENIGGEKGIFEVV